jgi:putative oxidoreductase
MIKKWLSTEATSTTLIIRFMVGLVFLSEGIQKFLYVETIGAGRFAIIGIPNPGFFGPFVGTVEIICSILLLAGFLTRLASIPLLIVISTAIITTKIPFLMHKGFWPALHESRTDYCMLMGLLFLIIMGGGKLSLDYIWQKKSESA